MADRGFIFHPFSSPTWRPLGRYDLATDRELGNGGNADYGNDSLAIGTNGPTIPSSTIGAFNGTGANISATYYGTGYLGLGVTSGRFNNISSIPALGAVAEQQKVFGLSYGYTAGAYYREIFPYPLHVNIC